MSGVLDPNGTWFWLLYSIAGLGWVYATLWWVINAQEDEFIRTLIARSPGIRAGLALVMWLLWPLIVALVLAVIAAWLFSEAWYYTSTAASWVRSRLTLK